MEKLSLRYNIPEETIIIQEDAAEEFKRLLGLVHTKPAQNEIVKEPESGAEMFPTWLSTGYTDDEVALAKKLTELCLSVSRADDYMTWKEVGWCLSSISPTEDMFDVWMEFSKRSAKFSYNDMNKLHRDWTSGWHYGGKRLGIGSLHLRFSQLPGYGCNTGLLGPVGGFGFGPKLGVFGKKPCHGFPEAG